MFSISAMNKLLMFYRLKKCTGNLKTKLIYSLQIQYNFYRICLPRVHDDVTVISSL